MAEAKTESKLATYEYFGVNFTKPRTGQPYADCFECLKENHLFVNSKTGTYNCKVCGTKGNIFTFLTKYHAHQLSATKQEHYKQLSALRKNLPWQAFKDANLAYDEALDCWLIPTSSTGQCVTNLRTFTPEKGTWSTPGCAVALYRGDKIAANGPIYVCEGEWDAIALDWAFRKGTKMAGNYSIVGVPGAMTFKAEWVKLFKDRDVCLLYDHDEAGRNGMDKVFSLLSKAAKSVRKIKWNDSLPDGYDIRDFVCERVADPKKIINDLYGMLTSDDIETKITLPKRTKFSQVVADFKRVLHMEQDQVDALAVMCAVVASTVIPDDPLWVYIVGPPSSGKTELMLSFLGMPDKAYFTSRFYAQQFVSGFSGPGGEDCSLIARILGKTIFIKDGTEMHTMGKDDKAKVESVLRGGYDGRVDVPFGNMAENRVYEGYFSIISGVTHVIHTNTNSSLGERFLKLNLLSNTHDIFGHGLRALENKEGKVGEQLDRELLLRSSIAGFFKYHPFDPDKLPKATKTQFTTFTSLAYAAGIIRTNVTYNTGGGLDLRPIVELPSRLAAQLMKMARCLCWVFGKTSIDKDIMRIIHKLAVHTVTSFKTDIINILFKNPLGVSKKTLADEINVSVTTVEKALEDLNIITWQKGEQTCTVVDAVSVPGSHGGQPNTYYYLSPEITSLWKDALLHQFDFPVLRRATRGPQKVPRAQAAATATPTKSFSRKV